MRAPERAWLPFLKVVYGYLMLILFTVMILTIGLGHVEEKTSYGLRDILSGVLVLSGMWSQWAFGASGGRRYDKPVPPKEENHEP